MNYNSSLPDRSIGGASLLGGILRQIASVVDDQAATKFSLMTGSYDTFLAFFGIMGLPAENANFTGLPNYASTMAFELYSEADNATFPEDANVNDELLIRFLFRNGTDASADLTAYPLAGLDAAADGSMTYGTFRNGLEGQAVPSVEAWCQRCGSLADFCVSANATLEQEGASTSQDAKVSSGSGLSAAAGGGIGAGVTLAVVAIIGLLAWMVMRRKRSAPVASRSTASEKAGSSGSIGKHSGSDSESV